MARQIFVNLPAKNLPKSKEFFIKLGFEFNPQFTNDEGACMVVSDIIFVMLLTETYFKTFTKKPVADATKTTEVIMTISADNRTAVVEMVNRALQAGGTKSNAPQDYGWTYSYSFQDLDGYLWEILYANQSAIPQS